MHIYININAQTAIAAAWQICDSGENSATSC